MEMKMSNSSGFVQPCITRSKSVENEPWACPQRSSTAEWKKVSSLYLHSRWPGEDIRKLCGLYLQARPCDSHKWQRKGDKWQTGAPLTRRSLLHVREIWLPDSVVWTLPEPRSKSYGDKSPRDTQTPPFTTEGSLFLACLPYPLTTNAEHRAIFSHSATKSIKAVIQRKKV